MPQLEEKNWWKYLKTKANSYLFPKTKIIKTKKRINSKILALLDEKAEIVNQLSNHGLIVLDRTILNSCDNKIISEQGIISSDFFKAKIIDVNNKIIKGVYFHLVKIISGIIVINPEHQITLEADEEFNKRLSINKLAAKLFNLFFNHYDKLQANLISKIKIIINESQFQLRFKKINVTKDLIFQVRNSINNFLSNKKLDYQNYQFLENNLTKVEIKNIFKLEKLEITSFEINGSNFIVTFLVGKANIDQFFLNAKKELLTSIKVINKKIKVINNDELISQFYLNDEINTYEDLGKLNQDYLQLKSNFTKFKNQNLQIVKNLVDQSAGTHYSERVADYDIVHISFNNFLIDKELLELKAKEQLTEGKNKILFLSNNNLDDSLLVWKISTDLINKINLKSLIEQFSSSSFIKINNHNDDTVFIEANNYQVINDFIQNIIKYLKDNTNNQTI